jgi:hypothetical protein
MNKTGKFIQQEQMRKVDLASVSTFAVPFQALCSYLNSFLAMGSGVSVSTLCDRD